MDSRFRIYCSTLFRCCTLVLDLFLIHFLRSNILPTHYISCSNLVLPPFAMPMKSRWSVEIPDTSLPTWIFKSPDKPISETPAFIDAARPDRSLSLSAFRQWSKRFAVGLQKAGVQVGDRVLLFSGNNLAFPVVFMGTLMAGGIFTGANPTFVARELAYQLRDSDAKFLITADCSLEVGLEAASMIGMSKDSVFTFDDQVFEGTGKGRLGVRNWSTLIASAEEGERFIWIDPKSPEDTTCALNYSSGTTGVPKGVEITHRNYVSNTLQVIHSAALHPEYEEQNKTTRWLCFLPMYHAFGQMICITLAPKRNTPVYIMSRFDLLQFLECIQKYKITDLALVPPVAVALTKHSAVRNFDLSSVRNVGSGAAPLSRAISAKLEGLWKSGDVNVKVSSP
jgi:4-coumarate--CoA ligase